MSESFQIIKDPIKKSNVPTVLRTVAAALALSTAVPTDATAQTFSTPSWGTTNVEKVGVTKESTKSFLIAIEKAMREIALAQDTSTQKETIKSVQNLVKFEVDSAQSAELRGELVRVFLEKYGTHAWARPLRYHFLDTVDELAGYEKEQETLVSLVKSMRPMEIVRLSQEKLDPLMMRLKNDNALAQVFVHAVNETKNETTLRIILTDLKKFNKYPWVKNVLENIAEKAPNIFVRAYKNFRGVNGALEVWEETMRKGLEVSSKIQNVVFIEAFLSESDSESGEIAIKWSDKERDLFITLVPGHLDILVGLTAENLKPHIMNLAKNKGALLKGVIPLFVGKRKDALIKMSRLPKPDSHYWSTLRAKFNQQEYATIAVVRKKVKMMQDLSAEYGGVNPLELAQNMYNISKHLYQLHEKMSDNAFAESKFALVDLVMDEIPKLQEKHANEKIFSTHTVVATHGEFYEGTPRFSSDAFLTKMHAAFERSNPDAQAGDYMHVSPSKFGSAEAAKKQTLESVRESGKGSKEPGLTLVLRGHGSSGSGGGGFDPTKSAFHFTDGQVQGALIGGKDQSRLSVNENDASIKITAQELLDAYIQRYKDSKLKAWAFKHPDKLILTSCFQAGMGDYINAELHKHGLPALIIITGAGDDQYGFTNLSTDTKSNFIDGAILQTDVENGIGIPTVLGVITFDLITKAKLGYTTNSKPGPYSHSNTTLAVPNKDNMSVRISNLEEPLTRPMSSIA